MKYPSISLNAIAKRSGVSEPTLRRLMMSKEKNRQPPAPNIVLQLVSFIKKEKRMSVLISKTEGPIGDYLRKSFDQFIFEKEDIEMSFDLNKLFLDKDLYLIYKLAANSNGVSLKEIEKILGVTGKNKLSELIEKNVIEKRADENFHAINKNFSVDVNVAKNFLPELIRFFKPELAHEGKTLFYSLSESMNESGIQKIKEIQIEAVKAIYKIMTDENNQGTIPYFSVSLLDTMFLNENMGGLQ
jgi:DNA-binding transcriptional MerR regulator